MSIAEWLLERNITLTGTMRGDRKGIPAELKLVAGREPKSTIWCYNGEKMLISYADKKKKKDPKLVLLVTTQHAQMRVSQDKRTKPQPIVYYDHMKGGVDVVDFITAVASTRVKSKRWTINALAYTLDTVRTNSKTLFNEVNCARNPEFKPLSTFEFTWELGRALALPWIQERYNKAAGLQTEIRAKMRKVLKLPEAQPASYQFVQPTARPPPPSSDKQSGRCQTCREEIYGPGYSQAKNSLSKKNTCKCAVCKHFICKRHQAYICGTCVEEK